MPAQTNMAVTADARAQAAAGEDLTVSRRVHTRRHGHGKTAWTERVETEVVGMTALTTYDQYGTPAHGGQVNRRDFQANPIHAVVVRQWQGKDYGPGGTTVFLTNVPVEKPFQVSDDDDDRSLIENCWTQGSEAAVGAGPSTPEKRPGRAGACRVHPLDVRAGHRVSVAV